MNGSKLCCLMAAGFWLSASIPGANAATLYDANFPTPDGGISADCSPCEDSFDQVYGRVFDRIGFPQIELGAPNVILTSIEFAIFDRNPLNDGSGSGGAAGDINLSIFGPDGSLLFSETQSNSQWVKKDVIDPEIYTVSFSLPNVVIDSDIVYISPFGVNGTFFAALSHGGGGDGGNNVAFWSESTAASGFVGKDNRQDYAIRVNGVVGDVTPIPLPASFLMLIAGLAGLGVMGRLKAGR